MPPAPKKRKVSATTTRHLTAPAAAQQGIQAFGKISKPQVQDTSKRVSSKNSTVILSEDASSITNSKKRKVGSACSPTTTEEVEEAFILSEQAPPVDGSISTPVEGSINAPTLTSTRTKDPRSKPPFLSDHVETPTKGARWCLESLALASSSPSTPNSSSRTLHQETPPSSPDSISSEPPQRQDSYQLPDELQDLVNLHSSFLTALSLHYAHNGTTTPADLRNLKPGIERAWRKRRVTTNDVRRILAVGRAEGADKQARAGSLYLSDYGHGKICVEVADNVGLWTTTRQPISEDVLNTVFLRDLEQRWTGYKNANPADPSPSNFLASLALLPITACSSLSKLGPLVSKGQRRLEDLKAGAIRAQQKPLSITSANPTVVPRPKKEQTAARSTDLFSRLKAKKLHQSTLPLPLSAEALARKSTLQRLHEITPVLQSLASSSEKHSNDDAAVVDVRSLPSPVSFTMPTLVQHLQMSLRNPIGKEEVVRCIRMLSEVAPEWVGLKEVGRMLGVTIKGARFRKGEIGQKIQSLLE